MNKDTENALKGIMDAIEYYFNENATSLPFDRTEVGKITEVLASGKYKVLINNREYILPVYGSKTPVVDEVVKVTIPKNNMSLAYIF